MRFFTLLTVSLAACDPLTADEICDDDLDGFVEDLCASEATLPAGDCDDADPNVHPGAEEVCNARDDNCDGLDENLDAVDRTRWYRDSDADGQGDPEFPLDTCVESPAGYSATASDCDDTNNDVQSRIWYHDGDGDGFGDGSSTVNACELPTGFVANSNDCDDDASAVNPGASEVCENGVDDNCDASAASCGLFGEVQTSSARVGILGTQTDELTMPSDAADIDGDGAPDLIIVATRGIGGVVLGPVLFDQVGVDAPVSTPNSNFFGTAIHVGNMDAVAGEELVVSSNGAYIVGWDPTARAVNRVLGGLRSSTYWLGRSGHVGALQPGKTALVVGGEEHAAVDFVRVAGIRDALGDVVDVDAADFLIAGEHGSNSFGPNLQLLDYDADGIDGLALAIPSVGAPIQGELLIWDDIPMGVTALADADANVSDGSAAFGTSMLVLPDSDGDGRATLAVSSVTVGTNERFGAVYLFDGSIRAIEGASTRVVAGDGDGFFGQSMAFLPAGVDDEFDILAVAAPYAGADFSGRVKLLKLPLPTGTVLTEDFSVGTILGTPGSATGWGVGSAGDQDNDGHVDLAVGSIAPTGGTVYVAFGGAP